MCSASFNFYRNILCGFIAIFAGRPSVLRSFVCCARIPGRYSSILCCHGARTLEFCLLPAKCSQVLPPKPLPKRVTLCFYFHLPIYFIFGFLTLFVTWFSGLPSYLHTLHTCINTYLYLYTCIRSVVHVSAFIVARNRLLLPNK